MPSTVTLSYDERGCGELLDRFLETVSRQSAEIAQSDCDLLRGVAEKIEGLVPEDDGTVIIPPEENDSTPVILNAYDIARELDGC